MKERPIPFTGPMVTALLDGRKTQTRRIVKRLRKFGPITEFNVSDTKGYDWHFRDKEMRWHDMTNEKVLELCPYGIQGEHLWVRETFSGPLFQGDLPEDHQSSKYLTPEYCHYKASGDSCEYVDMDDNIVQKWTPSIHMPRWASRILLEITDVRVERLQDISEEDAIAEGCESLWVKSPDTPMGSSEIDGYSAVNDYAMLWEEINGPGTWDINPWVWCIEFKRIG